jgi:actin-like ATPase involved in cell morphogenesis
MPGDVAVDLGTTKSVAAWLDRAGRLRLIPTDDGEPAMPSAMCGQEDLTPCDDRREVGATQPSAAQPRFAAEVLRAVKANAESYLGRSVPAIVAARPACWSRSQVDDLKQAAAQAGLRVRFVLAPVATAAWFAAHYGQGEAAVMVCDLGGAKTESAVVALRGGAPQRRAARGDPRLGGREWTTELVNLVAERLAERHGFDPRRASDAHRRLRQACESAKRSFAWADRAEVALSCDATTYRVPVAREEFEARTEALIRRVVDLCASSLETAGMDWAQIDRALLVGGGARLRRVAAALEEATGVPVQLPPAPEWIAAYGATLLGADPSPQIADSAEALAALEAWAADQGRLDEVEVDFEAAADSLRSITADDPEAGPRLDAWWVDVLRPLRRRLGAPELEDLGWAPGAAGWAMSAPASVATRRKDTGATPSVVPKADRVHFSVTWPPMVAPGSQHVFDVWAHLDEQREAVMRRARDAAAWRSMAAKSKGPASVPPESELTIGLHAEGLMVHTPHQPVFWEGEIANADFVVEVPENARPGCRHGCVTVDLRDCQIARIRFPVRIGPDRPSGGEPSSAHGGVHRKAFVSYASEDRDAVLARVQGLRIGAPDLEVFMDVLSLRAGQDWEAEIWKAIESYDVFYLCWSDHARESPEVEKEWRCALAMRGRDFIAPIPLVSPDECPPPPELADKHFFDWTLAFRRASGPGT